MTYPFKTKPYEHQRDDLNRAWRLPFFARFWEMGTGKSKVTIDEAAHLYMQGEIGGLLILAPKGMYHQWASAQDACEASTDNSLTTEWAKHCPDEVRYVSPVYVWSTAKTKKNETLQSKIVSGDPIFETKNGLRRVNIGLHVVVMNAEAFAYKRGVEFAEAFLRSRPCYMVVDEASMFKTPTSKRTKTLLKLGPLAKYRRVLTGTPVTNSPMDLYAPMTFLSNTIFGRSFWTFKCRYAVLEDQYGAGGRSFKAVVGYRRLDELAKKLEPHSSRYRQADCLDLPDTIYVVRRVSLGAKQGKIYEQLRDQAIVELEEMELIGSISAPLTLTRILRLRQVLSGHLPVDDEGGPKKPPIRIEDSERLAVLMATVEEIAGKVVIWAHFRAAIDDIAKALSAEHGKLLWRSTMAGRRVRSRRTVSMCRNASATRTTLCDSS